MAESEAKQVLEKLLEYLDKMQLTAEVAIIGEALRIAIEKLSDN